MESQVQFAQSQVAQGNKGVETSGLKQVVETARLFKEAQEAFTGGVPSTPPAPDPVALAGAGDTPEDFFDKAKKVADAFHLGRLTDAIGARIQANSAQEASGGQQAPPPRPPSSAGPGRPRRGRGGMGPMGYAPSAIITKKEPMRASRRSNPWT